MALVIESIMKKFANTIEVDINAANFTFLCNGNMLQLGTFIDVNNESGKDVVVGVGGDEPTNGEYIRVKLFEKRKSNGQLTNKLYYLDAFFRYAIRKVTGKRTMIRPKFVFKGIANLEEYLCGYQSFILDEAAKRSGAMECKFV